MELNFWLAFYFKFILRIIASLAFGFFFIYVQLSSVILRYLLYEKYFLLQRKIMENRWNNMPKNRESNSTRNVQRHTQFEPSSFANPLKNQPERAYTSNAMHRVPIGDTPYHKAKQMQVWIMDVFW